METQEATGYAVETRGVRNEWTVMPTLESALRRVTNMLRLGLAYNGAQVTRISDDEIMLFVPAR